VRKPDFLPFASRDSSSVNRPRPKGSEYTLYELIELKKYIEEKYGVIYKSDQSYYELLNTAEMSWKKTQKKTLEKQKLL